jgi:hypothetical protein
MMKQLTVTILILAAGVCFGGNPQLRTEYYEHTSGPTGPVRWKLYTQFRANHRIREEKHTSPQSDGNFTIITETFYHKDKVIVAITRLPKRVVWTVFPSDTVTVTQVDFDRDGRIDEISLQFSEEDGSIKIIDEFRRGENGLFQPIPDEEVKKRLDQQEKLKKMLNRMKDFG